MKVFAGNYQNRIKQGLATIVVAILFIACSAPEQPGNNIVARVGSFEITDKHFSNQLKRYYLRSGQALNINEDVRLAVVNARIERYTIVEFARDLGWAYDADAQYNKAIIERKVLMEEYQRRLIHEKVSVTDDDLRELFRRFNTKLRASHLYASSREEARELYDILMNGANFDELASKTFQDAHLAKSGGDLGYFTIDEMDVAFEDRAYRMKIGEISEPVKTSRGYSIIKLTEIASTPILTEFEYASKKHSIRPVALDQMQELATRQDMAEATRSFVTDEQVLNELWELVQKNRAAYTSYFHELNELPLPADETMRNKVILTFGGVPFTVQNWLTEAYYTPSERRVAATRLYDFREQLEGMAYRSFAVRRIQNHPRLDKSFVDGSIEESFYGYLTHRFEQYLDTKVSVSEREIADEFRKNGSFYENPVQLNLAEMLLDDGDLAGELFLKLQAGSSFKELLDKHGLESYSKELDGKLGFMPITAFGVLQTGLTGIKPGVYAGPFQVTDSRYIIFKCLDRKEANPMTELQAKDSIGERLFYLKRELVRNEYLAEARKKFKSSIDMDRLNTVTFEL